MLIRNWFWPVLFWIFSFNGLFAASGFSYPDDWKIYKVQESKEVTVKTVMGGAIHWNLLEKNRILEPLSVDKNIWLKLDIGAFVADNKTMVLYLTSSNLDYGALYYQSNGMIVKDETGFGVGVPRKKFKANFTYFILPSSAQKTYYIMLRSRLPVTTELVLTDQVDFIQKNSIFNAIKILYLIFTIGSIFYTLALYFRFKTRQYLYYLGYIIAGMSGVYNSFGAASMDFYPYWKLDQVNVGITMASIAMTFGLFFCLEFIRAKFFLGRFYDISYVFLVLYLACIAYSVFGGNSSGGLNHKAQFLAFLNLTLILFMITAAVYSAAKGYRPARMYIAVWGIMLGAVFLYALYRVNIITYRFWINYSIAISISLDFIFLNIGIYLRNIAEMRIFDFYQVNKQQLGRYKKSYLRNLPVEEIIDQIKNLMENEQVYKSHTRLTAKVMAEMVSISPHQLSEIMNQILGTSFTNYVNRYRTNEVKRILLDQPDLRIIDAAFDAGFETKSHFNSVFKKYTGYSPREYLDRQ